MNRLAVLGLLAGSACCAVFPLPCPEGRSGRLTTTEGAPVANAEVVVDTWDVAMGHLRMERLHTYRTTTDGDGRWTIPPRTTVEFVLMLPDAIPERQDDLTFRAAGQADLHVEDPPISYRGEGDDPEPPPSTMRLESTGPPPLGILGFLVVGGAFGGGQVLSGHAGGMAVASRGRFGAGLRIAAEAGAHGLGGAAGAVIVPIRGTTPSVAIELNGRYLQPWRAGMVAGSGPELALDAAGYRFTMTALGAEVDSPLGQRRLLFSFGLGYF